MDSLFYFCDLTQPFLWRAAQPPDQKSAHRLVHRGSSEISPLQRWAARPRGPTRPSRDGPSTPRAGLPRP